MAKLTEKLKSAITGATAETSAAVAAKREKLLAELRDAIAVETEARQAHDAAVIAAVADGGSESAVETTRAALAKAIAKREGLQTAIAALEGRLATAKANEAKATHDKQIAEIEALMTKRTAATRKMAEDIEQAVAGYITVSGLSRDIMSKAGPGFPNWAAFIGPHLNNAVAEELFRLSQPIIDKLVLANGNTTPVNWRAHLFPGAKTADITHAPVNLQPLAERIERMSADAVLELKGIKPVQPEPVSVPVAPSIAPEPEQAPASVKTHTLAEATAIMSRPKTTVNIDAKGRI